jgi:subtilisin family serine protease
VTNAGGVITRTIPEVDMLVVESTDASFSAKAAKISGIVGVAPNLSIQWIPNETVVPAEDFGNPPYSGDDDIRFDLQWGHDAVNAPEAWEAGLFGAGVRVAVLDSGIDADNPDLAPNLNTALSTSFVPGEGYDIRPGMFFNHGTHVAGTIAAADNGFGVIGIAPQAEIVAVKVLSEYTGSGSFEGVIAGIIYAAQIDADVINMSLGALLPRRAYWYDNETPDDPSDDFLVSAKEVAHLAAMMSKATTYATQMGTTVIASAGNDAVDKDHTADWISLPADAANVLAISATAPIGWAKDPANAFLGYPTSYTNYGQSAISFAAPGGDSAYPGNENCVVAGLTRPCWVFDLVFSTGSGAFYWAAGTSMAAPHVSGVAALFIGQNGGDMDPTRVKTMLASYADDLGKPGNDDFYGAGRVSTGYPRP